MLYLVSLEIYVIGQLVWCLVGLLLLDLKFSVQCFVSYCFFFCPFWPLCCLSFFGCRLLNITWYLSSNYSQFQLDKNLVKVKMLIEVYTWECKDRQLCALCKRQKIQDLTLFNNHSLTPRTLDTISIAQVPDLWIPPFLIF